MPLNDSDSSFGNLLQTLVRPFIQVPFQGFQLYLQFTSVAIDNAGSQFS